MILDVVDPYPRMVGHVDDVVIYVAIAVLIALCVIISLKVINKNKKGSEKGEEK